MCPWIDEWMRKHPVGRLYQEQSECMAWGGQRANHHILGAWVFSAALQRQKYQLDQDYCCNSHHAERIRINVKHHWSFCFQVLKRVGFLLLPPPPINARKVYFLWVAVGDSPWYRGRPHSRKRRPVGFTAWVVKKEKCRLRYLKTCFKYCSLMLQPPFSSATVRGRGKKHS